MGAPFETFPLVSHTYRNTLSNARKLLSVGASSGVDGLIDNNLMISFCWLARIMRGILYDNQK